jgi:hypothetical protein
MGRFPLSAAVRRRSSGAAAVLLAGAGLTVLPALAAQAADASTTVTPSGHHYTAALVSGTTATFVVGTTTVNCNQSTTGGAVPAEPGNSAAGAVVGALTPAAFANNGGACPTNVPLTTAQTVTNSTNGDWTNALQFDPAGSTGTLTIPRAGVITTISGLASCIVTVAPNAAASMTGPWHPGTATSAPVLDFSAGVSLPITVTGGFGCPTGATTATFQAAYVITDTTDPAQQITVSAAAAGSPTGGPTEVPAPTDSPAS